MAHEANPDVFEDVLNLEDRYYREGYELGVEDGSKSGRIEGRVFGLEKGFEKFLEMGKLNGTASVWKSRMPASDSKTTDSSAGSLPSISSSERLRKHVDRLAALTDPEGVSTENSEDAVSEFDDRLKDATAKATLISKIVGEDESAIGGAANGKAEGSEGKTLRVKRGGVEGGGNAGRNTGEMEDFLGLPGRS